jgi:hypothetical protein
LTELQLPVQAVVVGVQAAMNLQDNLVVWGKRAVATEVLMVLTMELLGLLIVVVAAVADEYLVVLEQMGVREL